MNSQVGDRKRKCKAGNFTSADSLRPPSKAAEIATWLLGCTILFLFLVLFLYYLPLTITTTIPVTIIIIDKPGETGAEATAFLVRRRGHCFWRCEIQAWAWGLGGLGFRV